MFVGYDNLIQDDVYICDVLVKIELIVSKENVEEFIIS